MAGWLALSLLLATALLTPPPSRAQEPPPAATDPGSAAQVHTGVSSGLEYDGLLRNLLMDHQFPQLAAELDKLPPEQAQLYRGLLANRDNDPQKAIALLAPLVDKLAATGDQDGEKLARKALAESYLRAGDWPQAAQAYSTLDARLHARLTPEERDEIELPLKLLPLAAGAPPVTVEPCPPFALQVTRNPLGLLDIPVFVDARPHSWMLDPTLPFNLIARSTAREVGLKLSEGSAVVHTLTGEEMTVHTTVIPRFTLGGRITVRNMTAFVFEDADYAFPQSRYQVEGALGYPALAAMGSLTVTQNATVEIRPARQPQGDDDPEKLTTGARFYLDGDRLLVALGKRARPSGQKAEANDERIYAIDAAGQYTYLTARYYGEHAKDFEGQKPQLYSPPDEASAPPIPAFLAETAPLYIGERTLDLHFLPVYTQPIGQAAIDDVYGVLGLDALDQLGSYTFDYRTMRFTARPR